MPISALGLDVGKKRIGVAGCDGTGLIAFGLTTIERKSYLHDLAILQQFVDDRQVQILVVGLPYSMDGTIGFQARHVQKFAKSAAATLNLPLEYSDERLTSVQAEELLLSQGISPSRNKALIDQKAAAIILQQWLDERRSRLAIAARLSSQNSSTADFSPLDSTAETPSFSPTYSPEILENS